MIVLAQVNSAQTLRAYGSKADTYATFKGVLEGGNPRESCDALMKEAVAEAARF